MKPRGTWGPQQRRTRRRPWQRHCAGSWRACRRPSAEQEIRTYERELKAYEATAELLPWSGISRPPWFRWVSRM